MTLYMELSKMKLFEIHGVGGLDRGMAYDPAGDAWQRRQEFANKAHQQFKTSSEVTSGEYKGKPYNLVVTITGPSQALDWEVEKFIDYHKNIHQRIVGVETEMGSATIYFQADPQSLLLQKAQGTGPRLR